MFKLMPQAEYEALLGRVLTSGRTARETIQSAILQAVGKVNQGDADRVAELLKTLRGLGRSVPLGHIVDYLNEMGGALKIKRDKKTGDYSVSCKGWTGHTDEVSEFLEHGAPYWEWEGSQEETAPKVIDTEAFIALVAKLRTNLENETPGKGKVYSPELLTRKAVFIQKLTECETALGRGVTPSVRQPEVEPSEMDGVATMVREVVAA